MSAPFGMYGGYKAESPESRVLGNFAADKFSYRDQAKNIIELNNFAGFASGMLRKMQKGIDKANANVIQQIQGYFRDLLILFGGGGDTGLDFGDLKYVFQAIGALFGFADSNGNITVPINLFEAAWHFFSNYIFPVDNFRQLINEFIDAAIATILDLFGEVPIVGQALQQWAVIISGMRDALGPLADALDALFGVFGGNWSIGDLGSFGRLWDIITTLFGTLTGPGVAALAPVFAALTEWTIPFIDLLTEIVNIFANTLNGPGGLIPLLDDLFLLFSDISLTALKPVMASIALWTEPFVALLTSVVNAFVGIVGGPGPWVTLLSGIANIFSEIDNAAIKPILEAIAQWTTPFMELLATIVNSFSDTLTGANGLITLLDQLAQVFAGVALESLNPIMQAISSWTEPFITLLNQLVTAFVGITGGPGPLVDLLKAIADIFQSINTVAFKPVLEAIALWSAPFVQLIVDLVTAFTSIVQGILGNGNLLNLINIFADLMSILNLFNTSGFGSGLLNPSTWINGVTGFANNILNPSNWAQSLLGFGNAQAGSTIVGAGQISNIPQNLVVNGLFGSLNAFIPGNGWSVDLLNTAPGGLGSALATVTNGVQTLIGSAVSVLTGNVLNFSTKVQWNGVSGSGLLSQPPISMNVNLYDANNNLISSTPIAAAGGAPGAAPTVTSGAPGLAGSWLPLTGSFTVPAPASPAPVYAALMYVVSNEINAGEVRFTVGSLEKTHLMPQEVVNQLPEDKQAIIDNAAGAAGATVTDIATRLAGINPTTGEIGWTYTPDVRTVNDALVKQLNGWTGSQYEHADAASALMAQKAATTAAGSTLNALQAQIAGIKADIAALTPPARVDVVWTDLFQRTNATSLGTGWSVTASGAGTQLLGTDGQKVVPNSLQLASRYFLCRWNGAQIVSNTNYQTIIQVLATAPTSEGYGQQGYNDVLGRVNGTNDYVRFRIYSGYGYVPGSWSLDYITAGVVHNIATGYLDSIPSTMKLICGNKDTTTLTFLAVYGDNTLLWSGTDANHLIGASYRGMGFGYGIDYVTGSEPGQGGFPDSWTGYDTQAAS